MIALGYHLASRLAYVLYIGVALTGQERNSYFTRRWGAERGFRRFRRVASYLMANDGVSFVACCLLSRNTLPFALPRGVAIAAGALLVVLGVSTKLWAAAALGARAYYWGDFFFTAAGVTRHTRGPYRLLENPMYTVGYLQTYGAALIVASLPGLVAALFDQAAIFVFHWRVEKPHLDRGAGRRGAARWRRPGSPDERADESGAASEMGRGGP